MRDLKRVSEGSDDHGDPRADGDNDGGREPRGEREHPVDDPVADILHKLRFCLAKSKTKIYLFLRYEAVDFENCFPLGRGDILR